MDVAKRKTLKAQYRQTRTEMGVYSFYCLATNRYYLGASQNLPAARNGVRFQLENNSYPSNRRLMEDWRRYGAVGFEEEVLEVLAYDQNNDVKADYSADLMVLKSFWRERLISQGAEVDNIQPKDR